MGRYREFIAFRRLARTANTGWLNKTADGDKTKSSLKVLQESERADN
jgi:hypothetical protein